MQPYLLGGEPRSATDRAVAQLRSEIVRGALEPGEFMSDTETAARLGISRTPVRDAFGRLEAEGLLVRQQGRLRVVEVDREQAEMIDEVRLPLELVALRQAIRRDRTALAYQLERTVVELRYELDNDQVLTALQAARGFHEVIYTMAGNPLLTRVLDQVYNFVHQYRYFRSAAGLERLDRSEREHRAIIAAIRARNDGEAERLLVDHLERANTFRSAAAGDALGASERSAGIGKESAPT
jgi:DNA-binding GntR family transcriptional regulator